MTSTKFSHPLLSPLRYHRIGEPTPMSKMITLQLQNGTSLPEMAPITPKNKNYTQDPNPKSGHFHVKHSKIDTYPAKSIARRLRATRLPLHPTSFDPFPGHNLADPTSPPKDPT